MLTGTLGTWTAISNRRLCVSHLVFLATIATCPYLLDMPHLRPRSFAREHGGSGDGAN